VERNRRAAEGGQYSIAGHNPHLGSLMAMLLEAALMVDLKKGALVRITTQSRLGPPRGVLKWMITPKVAKAL
jgi:phosphohistidine phosphatase SixA